jgi:hypothetical protein
VLSVLLDEMRVQRDLRRARLHNALIHQSLIGDFCIDELANLLFGEECSQSHRWRDEGVLGYLLQMLADTWRRFLAAGGKLIARKDRIWVGVEEVPEVYGKFVDL